MHTNLFRYHASTEEVYEALQRDAKRDSRNIQLMDLVVICAVLYLVRNLPRLESGAILVAVYVSLQRLNFFIDQSNRNFFMHLLDWQSAQKKESDQNQRANADFVWSE